MGVSFKISRVGSRYRPSIPPPADPPESADADADAPPLSDDRPADHERSGDAEVSFLGPDDKFGCFPVCTNMNRKRPPETEYEASFSLNLYRKGFFIGKPTEGMLLPLLEDAPKLLHPYDRASETLFSAIENGWLPGDILDDIPCKYYNGTLFCEVWDFRSCTESHDEFPKVQKVCLRMGSENVIKDMQSISNASWTYNDLLQVESRIINFMHPKLYLSTKPSFDRLCKEPVSKVDLGIYKRVLIKEQHDKPEIYSEPVDMDISSCGVTVNLKPQEIGSPKHGTLSCAQNNMRTGPFIQQSTDPKGTTLSSIQIASQPYKASDVGCSVSITNTAAVIPSVLLPPYNDPKDSFLHTKHNATCGRRNQLHAESTCGTAVKRAKRRLPVLDAPHKKEDSSLPVLKDQKRVKISQQQQEVQIRECVGISDQHCSTNKFLTTKVLEVEEQMASHEHGAQKSVVKELIQAKVSCRPDVGKAKEESSLNVGNKKSKQELIRRSQPCGQCDNGLSIVKHPKKENTSRKRKLTKSSQISSESSYQHQVSHFGKNQTTSLGTPGSRYPEIAATKDPAASVETASTTSASNSLIKESQIKDNKRVIFEAGPTTTCTPGASKCSLTRIPPPPDLSDVNNVSALHERFSKIEMITQRYGLNIKKSKVDKYLTKKLSPSCLVPPVRFLVAEDSEETGRCRNTRKIRILTYKRVQFSFAGNNLPFSASESWCKLVLSQPNELSDHMVGAEIIYLTEERHFHVVFLPTPHYADLFAAQFTSLMENDGYRLVNDQLLDSSYATYDSSFGSCMHTGSSGFASLPITTAEIGHPSRTPTLTADGVSSMHLHQCHQILPIRMRPSLNFTRPQRVASPDFNFIQQQIPMGLSSRPLNEMSLGAVSIPNSQGLVPLIPLQQCPHQPQGILQNKVASVRSSSDFIGGEAGVTSAILNQISAFNNPFVPVLNRGISPLLLNKPMMDFHNNISRRQHQLHLDSQKSLFSAQQQQQHNIPVIAQMRESTSLSCQQFLIAEGRQVVSGIANVGSPQLSSQTVGSAGSITNSPLDFVVMKEDNSSKDTL